MLKKKIIRKKKYAYLDLWFLEYVFSPVFGLKMTKLEHVLDSLDFIRISLEKIFEDL